MKIIVDFDDTIAKTKECALNYYQKKTNDFSTTILDYSEDGHLSYSNLMPKFCPLEIQNIFSSFDFYQNLTLYENSDKILKEWVDKGHEVIIYSGQRIDGITAKTQFINKKLPFIRHIVYAIDIRKPKEDIVGDVFIDNEKRHIIVNSSKDKILFGVDCKNWDELNSIIKRLENENN